MNAKQGITLSIVLTLSVASVQAEEKRAVFSLGENSTPISVPASKTVTGNAFANPADGCFSAYFQLPVSVNVDASLLIQGVQNALAEAQLSLTAIAHPSASWGQSLPFRLKNKEVDGYAALSINQSSQTATLATCYWTQRAPLRCEKMCLKALSTFTQSSL